LALMAVGIWPAAAKVDMVGQVHVCVFDVGSDECLICGTRAALVGQQTLHKMQPSWKRALQGVAEQVPRSRREWAHKPHFSRLICICVVRQPAGSRRDWL
jgi:hypothetical protein